MWTKPGAGFLCIEPWRGLPDPEGFVGDLFEKPDGFIVSPGREQIIRMTISLVDDDTTA